MELYEYIKIFKKYRRKIISIIIVVILAALGMSFIRSTQYEAEFSMIIRPKILEKTEDFKLVDAIDASDRVTRMTESWLNDKKIALTTKRLGNQIIKISFDEQNETSARERMKFIQDKSNSFIASLSPTPERGSFEALATDFSFRGRDPLWMVSLFGGLAIGAVIGFFAALFRYYLEK